MTSIADIALAHVSPDFVATRQAHADALISSLLSEGDEVFEQLRTTAKAQHWLREMPWKRVVAAELVGDLLEGTRQARVLEVGGGLSGITLRLAQKQDYQLVELATHEDAAAYRDVERQLGRSFVTIGDWAEVLDDDERFDVVVANDLFPNVDQRLDEFVDRVTRSGTELRMSLTYYEDTAFLVERVGSGERLTVKPWGLADVSRFVERLAGGRGLPDGFADQLVYRSYEGGLFGNRRNVLLLRAQVGR